eukprot:4854158-Prymnesium_polylepis.1
MSVSDSKATQNSVQNTVFEHIGAGASTSTSHHKDLDVNAAKIRRARTSCETFNYLLTNLSQPHQRLEFTWSRAGEPPGH